MKQGINLNYVLLKRNSDEKRSLSEGLALCKEAGFLELDYLSCWNCDDYIYQAKRARDLFDENGCVVHQSHCPFFRYQPNGIDLFNSASKRALEITKILGAKYFVVHADEWPIKGEKYDCSQVLEKNYELMAPLVDACAKLDILPAFENLFDDTSRIDDGGRDRFSAKSEDLLGLLEKFGFKNVGICLDTGHAYVSYKRDVLDFVRQVAPYVVCTHIHDNKSTGDLHQPAFAGTLPIEEIFTILKSNGYAGNLTWEMVYGRYPDEIIPDFLNLLYKSGSYIDRMTAL